ncbi:MAG: TadE/TadG family type IV pilus assembly protein [Actinomycetota bacterium]|nr:TadE/TadG family type IV pilus assembly protein [Actinomycetota bacterium]
MTGAATRRPGGDRGQAAVEVALVLPVVLVAALAVAQVGVVLRQAVLVTHAAREAARAAAVEPGTAPAAAAAAAAVGAERTVVSVSRAGGVVTVRVDHASATVVPVVGALVGDVPLSAEVTMRDETATS